MAPRFRSEPSPKAEAYIDSYLRDREASCHDIGRLHGVAHSTIAAVLRRWKIEQRYAVNVQKATIWAHGRKGMRDFSKQRERAAIARAKLKLRAIPLGEVARRLCERTAQQQGGEQ